MNDANISGALIKTDGINQIDLRWLFIPVWRNIYSVTEYECQITKMYISFGQIIRTRSFAHSYYTILSYKYVLFLFYLEID